MWCVPELTREYVERMEHVLDLMEKPANDREPVVALDERPVQLLATEREGRPMAPGRVARRDYEYVRRGTANIFCIVAPKTGRHLTYATANRKARRFAAAVKRISDAYPSARRIHLILDNLNTHRLKSLTDAYGEVSGRRLWRRFVIHHTPKHGSWLNPAEIEVSLWSRECAGRDRIATLCELKYRTRLWNKAANRDRRKINWRFTSADARRLFRYRPGTTPGPKD
jgi:DDE superfamily endonuclease